MNSGSTKRAWANDGPGAVWPCAQACESVDEIVGEPNWDEGIEMSKLNRDELTARQIPWALSPILRSFPARSSSVPQAGRVHTLDGCTGLCLTIAPALLWI